MFFFSFAAGGWCVAVGAGRDTLFFAAGAGRCFLLVSPPLTNTAKSKKEAHTPQQQQKKQSPASSAAK